MNKADNFTIQEYPRIRHATVDLLKAAKRKNMIHTLIEVDISHARKNLRKIKKETGKSAFNLQRPGQFICVHGDFDVFCGVHL